MTNGSAPCQGEVWTAAYGLACALLPDPHTLLLDEPADGLSSRECHWLHGMLRAHAAQGGTVLLTTSDPKEAARASDRVVTLDKGRLVADQDVDDFARTRLRPRVRRANPHAAALAALIAKEARTAQRSVEVVREEGNRLSVYGSTCADIGETAFRHRVLVHQLADEVGDMALKRRAPQKTAGSGEAQPCDAAPESANRRAPRRRAVRRRDRARAAGEGERTLCRGAPDHRSAVTPPAPHFGPLRPQSAPPAAL
ncbi:hypothetical protein SALBM311S_09497 [Streptomyces alboniger]